MDHLDLKTMGGIILATMGIVGGLKHLFQKWVKGKEPFLALALPFVFAIVSKLSGNFKGTSWIDLLVGAVLAGLASQISHDKIVNAVMARKRDPGVIPKA